MKCYKNVLRAFFSAIERDFSVSFWDKMVGGRQLCDMVRVCLMVMVERQTTEKDVKEKSWTFWYATEALALRQKYHF